MFDIGNYNLLVADEFTPHGLFLINEKFPEKRILLPGIELSQKEIKIGEKILLFVYLDSENRPTATLKNPKITLFTFAYLRVVSMTNFGAFVDWGLPKDLLVPFSELEQSVQEGDYIIVFLYYDTDSSRLVGSNSVGAILSNDNMQLKVGQEVQMMIWKETELGFKVIINDHHEGLLFHSDVFQALRVGEKHTAYIKQIRDDKKLDISMQKIGMDQVKDDAFKIYGMLMEANGTLPYSDKTSPQELYKVFGMSKKAFKRAVGTLYSSGKVLLEPDKIVKKTK